MDQCVQLKICEACGAFFTRPQQSEQSYCQRCAAILKDFPTPGRKSKRGNPNWKKFNRKATAK